MSTLRLRQSIPVDQVEAYIDLSLDRHGGPPVLMINSCVGEDTRFVHYYMTWQEAKELRDKFEQAFAAQAKGDE